MSLHDLSDSGALDCPICCDVFNNAFQTACGHAFCEYCIFMCLEKEPSICPVCRKNPTPIYPSFPLRRIIEEYRRFLFLSSEQIGRQSAQDYKQQGNRSYREGKYADALKSYTRAIDLSATAVLYANRAICYAKVKQHRLAIEDCDRAIQLDKTYVKAYVRKALSLEQENDPEKAMTAFKEAKKLDKNGTFQQEIQEGMSRLQGEDAPIHYQSRSQEGSNPFQSLNPWESLFGNPPPFRNR